ncbi:hypothetical protein GCM10008171_33210 [Methylopila jiangsuensis]|uniref:Uncharacterized protein n=1 Tax=Methylopila jiangsuensis TaxID=586230 RepID=A0A9W6JJA9_9HYPH|nr:hypothetical protein [Methylopila jiangsuensis]MDR6284544.1 hypothetical protein [Methylopila jiangsuensis]GLK78067.1 hypothetical protein GCM10008171_33210 [Methylopila jiangsuensis]
MERAIREALDSAGIRYVIPHDTHLGAGALDFDLPDHGLSIEVKQFHSPRIAKQMTLAPNIIVAQGRVAVMALAHMIRGGGLPAAPAGAQK